MLIRLVSAWFSQSPCVPVRALTAFLKKAGVQSYNTADKIYC